MRMTPTPFETVQPTPGEMFAFVPSYYRPGRGQVDSRPLPLSTSADPYRHGRLPIRPASDSVESVEDLPSVLQLTEDDVFAVHLRQLALVIGQNDEELGRVGVLPRVGHCKRATGEFLLQSCFVIVELPAVDRLS